MKKGILALVAALLLAGCAEPEAPVTDGPLETDDMVIHGFVQTSAVEPLVANVTIEGLNLTETTSSDGSFAFPPMPVAPYTLVVDAPGYITRTVSVAPGSNESLIITLSPLEATPKVDVQRYKGHLQCAAEYLILAGSCDRVLTAVPGGPQPFSQESIFEHHVPSDWASIVVDVVFDPAGASTYDGLRVTVKGVDDSDSLNDYEQYGRFHGSEDYTFRIEPEGVYADGVGPVPRNATSFLLDVFAQGHGWHAVCDPSGANGCFSGVGAGIDVQFELVVTTFTIQPAPEGFTQR